MTDEIKAGGGAEGVSAAGSHEELLEPFTARIVRLVVDFSLSLGRPNRRPFLQPRFHGRADVAVAAAHGTRGAAGAAEGVRGRYPCVYPYKNCVISH